MLIDLRTKNNKNKILGTKIKNKKKKDKNMNTKNSFTPYIFSIHHFHSKNDASGLNTHHNDIESCAL